jgi:hypothetical protein
MFLRLAIFALVTSSAFAQSFFPPSALPDADVQRYTEFLQALHEPSLFDLASRDPNDPVHIVGVRVMQLAHLKVHGRQIY